MKSPGNLIFDIHFAEKCFISDVLANFSKNVRFLGPHLSSKHFSYLPLNFSRQGASFKYPYDYFMSDDFLIKKVGNLVKTQNFC